VNYLLVLGLALFSSAGGALLVSLLHMSRSEPSRTSSFPRVRVSGGLRRTALAGVLRGIS
jgi:hypothetical protein